MGVGDIEQVNRSKVLHLTGMGLFRIPKPVLRSVGLVRYVENRAVSPVESGTDDFENCVFLSHACRMVLAAPKREATGGTSAIGTVIS